MKIGGISRSAIIKDAFIYFYTSRTEGSVGAEILRLQPMPKTLRQLKRVNGQASKWTPSC